MAAGFLVTLFEYSPLFSVSLVSLCFVVTAAIVLGWFGFDVPVILRSSDEAESVPPAPEKQMVRVANPFALEIGAGPASVTDGVPLKVGCLEPCVLSCFWGCEVSSLQRALQTHQRCLRLSPLQHFLEVLRPHCRYCQSFRIGSETREECRAQIPAEEEMTDFGPFPRDSYPLVAVLTLAKAKARDHFNFVANVIVIHVPDEKYRLSARILFQYLLTSQGDMYELKPLFMSADSLEVCGFPNSERSIQPGDAHSGASTERQSLALEDDEEEEEEEDLSHGRGRDCVVCQNAAVNRVLLPCRHACVCDSCMSHFQHCPICRAFVLESFTLTQ
ncbi:cell growth regulator with RING finger domain protein 1 isoform X1 [Brachionichthys hirsutus]|uniref:cell growth regulator with RING finger domain protein 1 isoform X1 n=1 Tax=Brachionichthys hirsutus TaxID=412623 RepID=UPI00360477F5